MNTIAKSVVPASNRFAQPERTLGKLIENSGVVLTRTGLAVVIGWIGAMKFTGYEANGISGFVSHSPLLSWTYQLLSTQQFSNALGVVEIAIAVGLIVGAKSHRIGVLAAGAAVGMFLTTLSFMLSTPGTFEPTLGGFPALSVVPGQFLIKDIVSLGASLLLLGNSLIRLETKDAAERSN